MSDRRLFLILTFAVIALFTALACALVFLRIGGSASFTLFGQSFSSTNIGLAVLFVAALILIYAIREFRIQDSSNQVLTSSASGESISWQETISGIDELVLQLTAADGFRPDLVIGICGGGLMVADLVAKRLGHVPCLSVWPDRHAQQDGAPFGGPALPVNSLALDNLFASRAIQRVLLVDDVAYSGQTLGKASSFLREHSAMLTTHVVELKTAVLFTLTSAVFRPDFAIYAHSRNRRMMPSSDRLRRLIG